MATSYVSCTFFCCPLVPIQVGGCTGPLQPFVLLFQEISHPPGTEDRAEGKSSRGAKADAVPGRVVAGPDIRSVYVPYLTPNVCHGKDNLYLWGKPSVFTLFRSLGN